MTRFNNPLNNVRVAAPCNADWEQMLGTERARFCGQCNLNVYNLSSMTRSEAEHLIASNEGRLCVRFYRRADGSILTKNCPVGLRAIQRQVSRFTKAIASAVLSFITGLAVFEGLSSISVSDRFPRREMGVMVADPPLPLAGRSLPIMGGVRIGELARDTRRSRRHRVSGSHQ
jgi:hypothetical protein